MNDNQLILPTRLTIFKKALPIIIANATVPLLGIVDTAVIGNLGDVYQLGGIAMGSMILTLLYWSFGFLRMSTTGFVAQSIGQQDYLRVCQWLLSGVLLALIIATLLLILQRPIIHFILSLTNGSEAITDLTLNYVEWRIWGLPATLLTFVITGLLVGIGASKKILIMQLLANGCNMTLDILLAGVFEMGVTGIALGTLIAEWFTLAIAIKFMLHTFHQWPLTEKIEWIDQLRKVYNDARLILSANIDIFLRTLLLLISFFWFINSSATFSDIDLAANHILLQFITFSAFFLDGYAYVAESQVGQSYGSKQRQRFTHAVRLTTELSALSAAMLALLLLFSGNLIIELLTDIISVQQRANQLKYYCIIYIALSFAAFQMDGIFIGCTQTKAMRNTSLYAVSIFFLLTFLLTPTWGNQGLWFAFIGYVIARPLTMLPHYRKLLTKFQLREFQPFEK